ncbi:bifunctional homocysteine S-methyltransferase/methylenetetrahydrofolate reductase [bacterium]|nr:bifunctional homocysteine S-methyltransferase/methylenetetrahydrofolate reductase [bacterium]
MTDSPSPIEKRPSLLEALAKRVVLADGPMGTMIYDRGVYINTSFESLNLSRGHLVKSIHLEFIQAGAELLETNTFSAHRLKLAKYGMADKVREINLAGVQLAQQAALGACWVAGTVGPPGAEFEGNADAASEETLRSVYREQLEYLLEGGVDAFFIESFSHLPTLELVVTEAKELAPEIPVVALVLINEQHATRFGDGPEAIGRALNSMPADVVGFNDGPGANALVQTLEAVRPYTKKPLALLPGTGMPVRHDDQTLHLSTPEYFMEILRRGIQHGAVLIGGSCGAHPSHIKAIKSSIKMLQPGEAEKTPHIEVGTASTKVAKKCAETPSRMAERLRAGKFVVSIEIDPPVGTDATRSLERAAQCRDAGVDCINIADGPRATARMGPVDMAVLLDRQVGGIEPIAHFCCRDRNLLGMQGDLIGANALGIHNILMITGDPPKLGDYPFATAVYDVDAIGALKIGDRLNNGMDLAGNPLKGDPTKLFLGCGANPGAIDLDLEIDRLKQKINAGAEYILTQPVYEQSLFERFYERVADFGVPILIGILPLASYRNAEFLHKEVPGMQVPEAIRERMKACPDKDTARDTGIEIAREALATALPHVQGTYIMPPFNRVESALEVLEVAKDRIEA